MNQINILESIGSKAAPRLSEVGLEKCSPRDIDRLVEKGLVERLPMEIGGDRYIVTDKGMQYISECRKHPIREPLKDKVFSKTTLEICVALAGIVSAILALLV